MAVSHVNGRTSSKQNCYKLSREEGVNADQTRTRGQFQLIAAKFPRVYDTFIHFVGTPRLLSHALRSFNRALMIHSPEKN